MPTATIETYLYRIQTDPNASANPTATAYFGETTTVGDRVFKNDLVAQVSWPLQSDKTVTLSNGKVLTDSEVSEGVTLIAYREKAAAEAAATPAPAPEPVPEE